MKNRNNNILNYKTPSRLPRGGFYSGDCPGAAGITIILSFFSSLRGTLGFAGAESEGQREWGEEQRAESEEQKAESMVRRAKGKEQAAWGEEQRAEGRESGAESQEQRAEGKGPARMMNDEWRMSNKECRISLPGLLTGNVKSGRNIEYRIFNNQYSTMNQQPLSGTWNPKPETRNPEPGTRNPEPSGTKYKADPLLPRGGFYSGDCPGAAAITIFLSFFSSPWVSPNFAGAKRLAVSNRLARKSILPVINQRTFHLGSFVPEFSGVRGSMKLPGAPGSKVLKQKGGPPMS